MIAGPKTRAYYASLIRLFPEIRQVCEEYREDPFRFASLIWRESHAGDYLTPKGPGGTGDHGHGHGLCQIDDRTWGDWIKRNEWWIPLVNMRKGCAVLRDTRGYIKSLAAMPAVTPELLDRVVYAGYNCGPSRARRGLTLHGDPDHFTADSADPDRKGDYSRLVFERANKFRELFPELALSE